MGMTEERTPQEASDSPLLELVSVAKEYSMASGSVAALHEIDLRVDEGEFVAIMGPSGSGKSTLMNILGCLDVPSRGIYRLAQREVSRLRETELARVRNAEIGFVFQSFNLLPRATAQVNVELPLVYQGVSKSQRRQLAQEALATVGLTNRAHHRPAELSGGQSQRVAVARALVTQPRILLADEPTGNLDSQTTEEILTLFEEIHARGKTVMLVTHEPEVSQRAARILHLRDGRLVCDERRD